MNAGAPLHFRWDGENMIPLRPKLADKEYCIGETYWLGVIEGRSHNTHNHYFAMLHEAWSSLPDDLAERFQTEEYLRKYALIKAGYFDERSIVCGSKAEAQRVAAFIKPMDDFAVVTVSEAAVRVYTAKSQSKRAMGAKDFQESKTKVLEAVADLIGVTPETLAKSRAA